MRVAIAGVMGSGKSEILKAARQMGIATLSADEINAELLKNDEYIAQIAEIFPSAVRDGAVDRSALASIVFNDEGERAKLNALAHPRILARIEEEPADPLVAEMPLLAECGAQRLFDVVVLVSCSEDIRRQRLIARGMSEEDIEARLATQMGEADVRADFVLTNDGTREELREKATRLFCEILGFTY